MLVVGGLVGAPGPARNGQEVPELLRRGVPVATGQDLVPVGNRCGRLHRSPTPHGPMARVMGRGAVQPSPTGSERKQLLMKRT